jgi:hypothetical protein
MFLKPCQAADLRGKAWEMSCGGASRTKEITGMISARYYQLPLFQIELNFLRNLRLLMGAF